MKNLKRIALCFLSVCMCLSMQCFAATETTGSTPVELTAEPMSFSVTLPTTVAINVAASGEITVGQGGDIVNNSAGPVRVTGISAEVLNGWELVEWGTRMPIGSKKLALKVAGTAFGADGSYAMGDWWTDKNPVPGGGEIEQVWDAQAPLQKTAVTTTNVAKVTYTVAMEVEENVQVDEAIRIYASGNRYIGDIGLGTEYTDTTMIGVGFHRGSASDTFYTEGLKAGDIVTLSFPGGASTEFAASPSGYRHQPENLELIYEDSQSGKTNRLNLNCTDYGYWDVGEGAGSSDAYFGVVPLNIRVTRDGVTVNKTTMFVVFI